MLSRKRSRNFLRLHCLSFPRIYLKLSRYAAEILLCCKTILKKVPGIKMKKRKFDWTFLGKLWDGLNKGNVPLVQASAS